MLLLLLLFGFETPAREHDKHERNIQRDKLFVNNLLQFVCLVRMKKRYEGDDGF